MDVLRYVDVHGSIHEVLRSESGLQSILFMFVWFSFLMANDIFYSF